MRGSKSIGQTPQSGISLRAREGRDVVAEVDQEADLGKWGGKAHLLDISATHPVSGCDILFDRLIRPDAPTKLTTAERCHRSWQRPVSGHLG